MLQISECTDIDETVEELEREFEGDGIRPRCPVMATVSVICSDRGNCINQGRRKTVRSCDDANNCLRDTRCSSFKKGSLLTR